MIYLDNAATTYPKPECVYSEMDKVNRERCMNAGRGSYKEAHLLSDCITETKARLRDLVSATFDTPVVFSPSITIALNQIINGIKWVDGVTVYVSPYEHNAVARTIHKVAKEKKIDVKELPIDKSNYEIDIEQVKYEFSKYRPFAIFCTHISNVTGYILPVKEIFAEGKKYNSINVIDTAQSLGLIEVDSRKLNADIIAFAGHKSLYGPFGIGGFINVGNVSLNEYITGGTGSNSLNLDMPSDSEGKYEASSYNIVAISGLNAALKVLNQERNFEHENKLTKYLLDKLFSLKNVKIVYKYPENKQIGIVSFTMKDLNSDDVGIILDEDYKIAVRTGYHCAPYIHKYLNDEKNLGTIRVGIGQFTTTGDIDALIESLLDIGGGLA